MSKKPLIFITNDDGYRAKGIASLIDALKGLGEIVVVVPDGPRSGYSSALTSVTPLRFFPYQIEEDLKIYVCNGTPVDCVKLGLGEILEGRMPDLVATGINHGANSAVSVLYSGTMGAAIEGCLFKVPSVGFSLLDHGYDADFTETKKVARHICKMVLKEGLPIGTCLNVNVPKGNDVKGIKIATQAKGKWVGEYKKSEDGGNHPVYWLTGEFQNHEPENTNTDEYVLSQGYVSVVPVKVDMTDYEYAKKLKHWELVAQPVCQNGHS